MDVADKEILSLLRVTSLTGVLAAFSLSLTHTTFFELFGELTLQPVLPGRLHPICCYDENFKLFTRCYLVSTSYFYPCVFFVFNFDIIFSLPLIKMVLLQQKETSRTSKTVYNRNNIK